MTSWATNFLRHIFEFLCFEHRHQMNLHNAIRYKWSIKYYSIVWILISYYVMCCMSSTGPKLNVSIENESVIHNLVLLRHCAHTHAQWRLTILTIEPAKTNRRAIFSFPCCRWTNANQSPVIVLNIIWVTSFNNELYNLGSKIGIDDGDVRGRRDGSRCT